MHAPVIPQPMPPSFCQPDQVGLVDLVTWHTCTIGCCTPATGLCTRGDRPAFTTTDRR